MKWKEIVERGGDGAQWAPVLAIVLDNLVSEVALLHEVVARLSAGPVDKSSDALR